MRDDAAIRASPPRGGSPRDGALGEWGRCVIAGGPGPALLPGKPGPLLGASKVSRKAAGGPEGVPAGREEIPGDDDRGGVDGAGKGRGDIGGRPMLPGWLLTGGGIAIGPPVLRGGGGPPRATPPPGPEARGGLEGLGIIGGASSSES